MEPGDESERTVDGPAEGPPLNGNEKNEKREAGRASALSSISGLALSGTGASSTSQEGGTAQPASDEGLGSSENESCGNPLIQAALKDKYQIISLIGEGGAALVYKARHVFTRRLVAVKVLFPHMALKPDVVQRFQVEAQAASRLSHPNIVEVFDYGLAAGGQPYLVMEYLSGINLADELEATGHLPVERCVALFIQVCDALAAAHDNGVLHRDLKPRNIMLCPTAEGGERAILVDFGLAKAFPPQGESADKLTRTGDVFGSPLYMSPEQCCGTPVDHRADLYSLGCLMYETLTGLPPIVGKDPVDTIVKQVSSPPAKLPSLECDRCTRDQLEAIILKLLAKIPRDRYPSARLVKDDLTKLTEARAHSPKERFETALKLFRLKVAHSIGASWPGGKVTWLLAVICLVAVGILVAQVEGWDRRATNPTIKQTWIAPPPKLAQTRPSSESVVSDFLLKATAETEGLESSKLATQLEHAARFFRDKRQYAEAEQYLERALQIRDKVDGAGSMAALTTALYLADCYFDETRFAQAKPLYERGIWGLERLLGERSALLASPASKVAAIYAQQGQRSRAESYFKWAISIWSAKKLERSADFALACGQLADLYCQRQDWSLAEQYYRRALDIWDGFQGPQRQNAGLCMLRLAEINERQGRWKPASECYRRALETLAKAGDLDELTRRAFLRRYADCLWKDGRWLQAMTVRVKGAGAQ